MRNIPANRVAAIVTWLTGLGAFIASVEGTLPGKWQNTALAAVGVITALATTLKFLEGSQRFDALVSSGVHVASDFAVTRDTPAVDGVPTDHKELAKAVAGLPDPGAEIAPAPPQAEAP